MTKNRSLRRTLVSALILVPALLAFDNAATAARAESNRYTALIQIQNEGIADTPPPFYLYFFSDRSEVRGVFYWTYGNGNVWTWLFDGNYSGPADGSISGTVAGYIYLPDFADKMCIAETEMSGTEPPKCAGDRSELYRGYVFPVTGTWSGHIFLDGTGSGNVTILAEGGQPVSRIWTVIDLEEGFLEQPAAPESEFVPPLTDNPYPGGYSPEPTALPEPAPETAENAETVASLESDATQMAPFQIPAMAGAAVAGAVIGLGVAQVGSSLLLGGGSVAGRKAAQAAQAAMAYSPATGKLVPEAQAQHEHQLMNQGYIYRSGEGWVAPHDGEYVSREPSIATKDAEAARVKVRADMEQWKAESKKRMQEEELSDFRWNMAYEQRKAEALMRRQLAGYRVAEIVTETVVDVAAAVLVRKVPFKALKYAKATLQFVASEVYSQTKIVTTNAVRAWRGQQTSFWKDEGWHASSLLLNKVPDLSSPTEDVARITAEEAAKSGTGTAARSGFEALTGN
jgi:hypothetical protein